MLLHKSVIRGHYIKNLCGALTLGEIVSVDCKHRNTHDRHVLCLLKGGSIIGIALSSMFFMTCLKKRHGSHRAKPRSFVIT